VRPPRPRNRGFTRSEGLGPWCSRCGSPTTARPPVPLMDGSPAIASGVWNVDAARLVSPHARGEPGHGCSSVARRGRCAAGCRKSTAFPGCRRTFPFPITRRLNEESGPWRVGPSPAERAWPVLSPASPSLWHPVRGDISGQVSSFWLSIGPD